MILRQSDKMLVEGVTTMTQEMDEQSDTEIKNRFLRFESVLTRQQFAGKVFINEKGPALLHANNACVKYNPRKLVIFTDASTGSSNSHSGVGIAILEADKPRRWQERYYALPEYSRAGDAETIGVCEAVVLANRIVAARVKEDREKSALNPAQKVVVYTDSQEALDFAQKGRPLTYQRVVELANLRALVAEMVQGGIAVEMRWVPGHSGVEGNVLADALAKRGRLLSTASYLTVVPPTLPFNLLVLEHAIKMRKRLEEVGRKAVQALKLTKKASKQARKVGQAQDVTRKAARKARKALRAFKKKMRKTANTGQKPKETLVLDAGEDKSIKERKRPQAEENITDPIRDADHTEQARSKKSRGMDKAKWQLWRESIFGQKHMPQSSLPQNRTPTLSKSKQGMTLRPRLKTGLARENDGVVVDPEHRCVQLRSRSVLLRT